MLATICFLARTIGRLSRLFGRGGGTSLPGKIALRLYPSIASELTSGKYVILISATNGKTTTTNLLAGILTEAGNDVVTNSEGANLMSGIVTALLKRQNKKKSGSGASQTSGEKFAILEVDEAVLPIAIDSLSPKLIVLGNLFRDQLDRYGEVELLVSSWQEQIPSGRTMPKIVANADDPLIISALLPKLKNLNEKEKIPQKIFFYGLEDKSIGRVEPPLIYDSYGCRECNTTLSYEFYSVGHLGKWSCDKCGLENCPWNRPTPDFQITKATTSGIEGVSLEIASKHPDFSEPLHITAPLPGLHNIYNVAAASSAALALNSESVSITPQHIESALKNAPRRFGRFEEINTEDGKSILLVLAKNPASANENLHTISQFNSRELTNGNPNNANLNFLAVLNDKIADGKDTSWIWDVDYEMLIPSLSSICVSGTRAGELALRFQYGGLPEEKITLEQNLKTAFQMCLKNTAAGERLIVLVTYTALLELYDIAHEMNLVEPYWKKN